MIKRTHDVADLASEEIRVCLEDPMVHGVEGRHTLSSVPALQHVEELQKILRTRKERPAQANRKPVKPLNGREVWRKVNPQLCQVARLRGVSAISGASS